MRPKRRRRRRGGQREAGSPSRVLGHDSGRRSCRKRRREKLQYSGGRWRNEGKKTAENDRSDKSRRDMRRNEAQNSHSAFRIRESFHCRMATSTAAVTAAALFGSDHSRTPGSGGRRGAALTDLRHVARHNL